MAIYTKYITRTAILLALRKKNCTVKCKKILFAIVKLLWGNSILSSIRNDPVLMFSDVLRSICNS